MIRHKRRFSKPMHRVEGSPRRVYFNPQAAAFCKSRPSTGFPRPTNFNDHVTTVGGDLIEGREGQTFLGLVFEGAQNRRFLSWPLRRASFVLSRSVSDNTHDINARTGLSLLAAVASHHATVEE